MSDAVHDTQHATDALGNLLSFLKGKPKLASLVSILAAEVQAAEDAIWQLLTQRYAIITAPAGQTLASGQQLDGIGDIVVQPRGGFGDSDYIVQLLVKIALNSSSGRINDVLNIMATLNTGAGIQLRMVQARASFYVRMDKAPNNPTGQATVLRSATAAGVSSQLIAPVSPTDASTAFTYAPNGVPVASSTKGYGNSASPGTGGHYVSSY